MHIPDGYLSPQTYLPAYAVMVPIWALALRRLQATLRARQVPLLALGAAFCFVIMMFNIPIPGGTTGHAVGAVLIAILLGPWAAIVAVSLALTEQALLFGDGGITALGANCLNMAVIMPLVGWGVYRLLAGRAPAGSRRHLVAAGIGGYLGLNAAALSAGVMFGIQPLIAHDAAGRALYAPFGLHIAVTAMVAGHLLIGFVEALVTGLVLVYLQRTAPGALPAAMQQPTAAPKPILLPRLVFALGVLALLSPLGLYLPAHFHAGAAWGEWGKDEIAVQVAKAHPGQPGYFPHGMTGNADHWRAPLPDYAPSSVTDVPLSRQSVWYVFSALIGGALLIGVSFGLRRKRKNTDSNGREDY